MSKLHRLLARTCAAASLIFAAALPAHAAFVYTLDVRPGFLDDHGDFTLTVNQLITTDASFQLADFDAIDPLAGTTSVTFEFLALDQVLVMFQGSGQGLFWQYSGALMSPGTYCTGLSSSCANKAAEMTITEKAAGVPEPATLALMGAAIAAAGVVRRRRQAAG